MSNIINAIINLVEDDNLRLKSYKLGNNRANIAGDAVEDYVKDLFANSFGLDVEERNRKLNETFSYLGNSNNPPDAMLKQGDAIEIKKIESESSALALNSSYPKHTLRSDNPMLKKGCRTAENWTEKEMLYVVGVVKKDTDILKDLCMVYGRNYCASEETYTVIKERIKEGVESIPGIKFTESKELGHINKVDPLGITYFRIRGMWGISNPWTVFHYIYKKDPQMNFNFMCIIDKTIWDKLYNKKELIALSKEVPMLNIYDKQVNNPDNPAKLDDVKLITFSK